MPTAMTLKKWLDCKSDQSPNIDWSTSPTTFQGHFCLMAFGVDLRPYSKVFYAPGSVYRDGGFGSIFTEEDQSNPVWFLEPYQGKAAAEFFDILARLFPDAEIWLFGPEGR